jgi:hypothetical protein
MQNQEYMLKLLGVFSDCEEIEDLDSLRLLAKIFKNIGASKGASGSAIGDGSIGEGGCSLSIARGWPSTM